MFEEFSLTAPTKQKAELPTTIRVGDFQRKTAKVPVVLPIDVLNGLCFETNQKTQDGTLRQMQYMALDLIKRVSPEILRLAFVDIGLNTNFPILHSLNLPNIKFITNRDNLKREMDALFETARYISTKCLGGEFANLKEYNKKAAYKEPYNFLFIANFPKEFREEEVNAVSMFVNEGAKCGIQVIMNLDKTYFPNVNSYNQTHFAKLYDLAKQMTYLDCTKPMAELHNFDVKIIRDWLAKECGIKLMCFQILLLSLFPILFNTFQYEIGDNDHTTRFKRHHHSNCDTFMQRYAFNRRIYTTRG